ncbi:MAG: AbgT family transporter [Treponema sp.]|nr:AbgT family transporter [Treponema sp.]
MKDKNKDPILFRALGAVERVGNRLPDPFSLFLIFCAMVFVLSAVVSAMGVTAIHPKDGSVIRAVNLLTVDGLRGYLGSIVANFQGFPPLGLVLVVVLGVGVAEKSGLMETALKAGIIRMPKHLVTLMLIFIGILSNAAGDSGFIVLPPLGALVFMSIGRHPLIGLFAAFASVAASFAANVMVNMLDVLIAGFTIPAAQMVDPDFQATPAMNYIFLLVSTPFLVVTAWFVTEKIVAPRFENVAYEKLGEVEKVEITPRQRRGLRCAGIAVLIFIAMVIFLSLGENAFFADPVNGSLVSPGSPLMKGLIPIIMLMFLVPGVIYGMATGSIKKDKDMVAMMGKSMSEMGPYIVLAFGASQFLALFTTSNLGIMLAISGAELLADAGGIGLILGLVLFAAFVNLFIGSSSAKWAILAPIFVPMFMLIGIDPALTQAAYRVGDSVTNPITPLFPYFPIVLGFVNKYDKNAGIGTVISNMIPYSISFLVVWTALLLVFIIFGIPLGF